MLLYGFLLTLMLIYICYENLVIYDFILTNRDYTNSGDLYLLGVASVRKFLYSSFIIHSYKYFYLKFYKIDVSLLCV
jgi:hypothetical protein